MRKAKNNLQFTDGRELSALEAAILHVIDRIQYYLESNGFDSVEAYYRAEMIIYGLPIDGLKKMTAAQWVVKGGSELKAVEALNHYLEKVKAENLKNKEAKLIIDKMSRW